MKLNRYIAVLMVILLSACNKEKELPELKFDVSVESATVRVNEPVQFKFQGDPGTISFFSGEPGNEYLYKDKAKIDPIEEVTLSFSLHNQEKAPLPATSGGIVKVMFSTDFDGVYTYDHVQAATWQDISNRFIIAKPALWGSNLGWYESGISDITDLKLPGKNFYIAFKYESITGPAVADSRWRMSTMRLDLLTQSGVRTALGSFNATTDALFSFVSRDNPQTSRSYIATTGIAFFSPLAPADGTPQKADIEDWVISPAYLADDINLGAEYATAIKGYGNPRITDFTHTFEKEGVYRVVFIAANANQYGKKEVIKEIEITVLP